MRSFRYVLMFLALVAAGVATAVKAVNSTDDDCSAGDVECRVFVTY